MTMLFNPGKPCCKKTAGTLCAACFGASPPNVTYLTFAETDCPLFGGLSIPFHLNTLNPPPNTTEWQLGVGSFPQYSIVCGGVTYYFEGHIRCLHPSVGSDYLDVLVNFGSSPSVECGSFSVNPLALNCVDGIIASFQFSPLILNNPFKCDRTCLLPCNNHVTVFVSL